MEEEYKKVFEELVEFVKGLSVADNDEDTNILSDVREKVNCVHRDLPGKISSNTELAYFFIKDSQSAVINALNDVCDKLSDLSIKANIQSYVDSLQQQQQQQHDDECIFSDDEDVDDDDDDSSDSDDGHPSEKSVFSQRKDILDLEIKYYGQVLNFLAPQLLKTADKDRVKPHPDHIILLDASSVIRGVRYKLEATSLGSGEHLKSMITNSRSKLQTYLNTARTKVANPTIKDDLDRFIQTLHFQTLHSQIFDSSLDNTRGNNGISDSSSFLFSEMKPESCSGEGESGSGGCKSPINDLTEDYYVDHDWCMKEQEERYFPRYTRGNNGMSDSSSFLFSEMKPESCSGEGESGSGGCKSPINDLTEDYYVDHDWCMKEQEERYFPRYTRGNNGMSDSSSFLFSEMKPESCSGEGESGSGGCKSPINLPEAKDEHDLTEDYYVDHDWCMKEQEERNFPRYIRIGNWDPKYEGHGISLLDPSAVRKDESWFVSKPVRSSNLLWEEYVLANMGEGSPKFLSEDESDPSNMIDPEGEPDLADMSQGSPKFRPEDELDHANTSEGYLKG